MRTKLTPCQAVLGLALTIFTAAVVNPAAAESTPTSDPRLIKPLPPEPPPVPEVEYPSANPIDRFLARKWKEHGVRPAPLCDDYDFVRRICLDLAGVIPTAEQIQRFMEETPFSRRARLIDRLLDSNRYAAHWSVMWEDLLRAEEYQRGAEPGSFRSYVIASLNENKPYDQWVREMITATGMTKENPGANLVLRHNSDPDELTITVTQVFMGVQLKCVQCHDDRTGRFWKQDDFKSMAGFWKGTRTLQGDTEKIMTPRGEREIMFRTVAHKPGKASGRFLGEAQPVPWGGPDALADRLVARSNPYFARVAVNRIWAQLMGVGLVDPVDDFDPDNPPSHPELLDWLAVDFIDHGYDLKHVIRQIANSRAYQSRSQKFRGNAGLADADRTFAAMPLRRLTAEQLYDSILVCCGLLNTGDGRFEPAIEIPAPASPGSFLRTFGSHDRQTIHARETDATIPQSLALLNGDFVNRAVSWHPNNPVRVWSQQGVSKREAIERLFLQTLSRRPTDSEMQTVKSYFEGGNSDEKWSDMLWSLINTREFMFIR